MLTEEQAVISVCQSLAEHLTEKQAETAVYQMLGEHPTDGTVKTIAPTLEGTVVRNLKAGGASWLSLLVLMPKIIGIITEYGPQIVATVTDLVEQAKQLADKVREILKI